MIRAAASTQPFGRRRDPMGRTWTIIGVGDVSGSFKWYQSLSDPDCRVVVFQA